MSWKKKEPQLSEPDLFSKKWNQLKNVQNQNGGPKTLFNFKLKVELGQKRSIWPRAQHFRNWHCLWKLIQSILFWRNPESYWKNFVQSEKYQWIYDSIHLSGIRDLFIRTFSIYFFNISSKKTHFTLFSSIHWQKTALDSRKQR